MRGGSGATRRERRRAILFMREYERAGGAPRELRPAERRGSKSDTARHMKTYREHPTYRRYLARSCGRTNPGGVPGSPAQQNHVAHGDVGHARAIDAPDSGRWDTPVDPPANVPSRRRDRRARWRDACAPSWVDGQHPPCERTPSLASSTMDAATVHPVCRRATMSMKTWIGTMFPFPPTANVGKTPSRIRATAPNIPFFENDDSRHRRHS